MARIACLFSFTILIAAGTAADESTSFRHTVAPILQDHCIACHGPQQAEGGYRVDTYDELFKAGDSGETPVSMNPNEPSELLRRLTCDESERMPAEAEPLSQSQIDAIQAWISSGAKFDGEHSSDSLSVVIPPPRYDDPPQTYAHPMPVTAVCFSPDGQQLIVGGYHELLVWNVASGGDGFSLDRRISNLGQRIFCIAISGDGQTVAVGCGEPGRSGELRLLDFASGEVRGVVARTDDVVLDVAFRPGTSEIAVASADSLIRIIDLESLSLVRQIASHADWVTAVAWSEEGKRLVSGSRDKTAKVFDGESGDLLASYSGHTDAVRGVAVLPGGQQVVSTGADQTLHRWQLEDTKRVAQTKLGGEAFRLVRHGDNLFIPSGNHRLQQIGLSDSQIVRTYEGHSDWVLSVALNTKGTQIASGGFNGEICLWNTEDGSLIQSWLAKP